MDHKPIWIRDSNRPFSTPKEGTVLDDDSEPGINGYEPQLWFGGQLPKLGKIQANRQKSKARTEPEYHVHVRVPVQKSRYHRYRKSTGMKAVGRSKAFWLLRRYQCQLLNEIWEGVIFEFPKWRLCGS